MGGRASERKRRNERPRAAPGGASTGAVRRAPRRTPARQHHRPRWGAVPRHWPRGAPLLSFPTAGRHQAPKQGSTAGSGAAVRTSSPRWPLPQSASAATRSALCSCRSPRSGDAPASAVGWAWKGSRAITPSCPWVGRSRAPRAVPTAALAVSAPWRAARARNALTGSPLLAQLCLGASASSFPAVARFARATLTPVPLAHTSPAVPSAAGSAPIAPTRPAFPLRAHVTGSRPRATSYFRLAPKRGRRGVERGHGHGHRRASSCNGRREEKTIRDARRRVCQDVRRQTRRARGTVVASAAASVIAAAPATTGQSARRERRDARSSASSDSARASGVMRSALSNGLPKRSDLATRGVRGSASTAPLPWGHVREMRSSSA